MMTTRSIAHRSGAIPFRLIFPLAFFNVFGRSKNFQVKSRLFPTVLRALALVFFFSVSFLGFGQNYSLNYSGDETVFTDGNVPDSVVASNARTIEFWIKPALDNASYKYIFNIGPTSATNFFAVYYRNGNVIFNNYQTDITIGAVATSTWHHVAIVFDGASTISTYLDGVAGGSGGAAINTTQTVLSIGALNYNGTAEQWFIGQIDEFRIWDVARDITAINTTKDVSLVGDESNLVAYYDFNDGTGSSSLTDLAGGNNVTTISGINTSTDWMTGAPIDLSIIYWSESAGGLIKEFDGNSSSTLLSALTSPSGVAFGAGTIYWSELTSIKKNDGATSTLVTGLGSARDIGLDLGANKIYWTDFSNGNVGRSNLDGSGVENILTSQTSPFGLDIDLTNGKIYFVELGTSIKRANLDGSGLETLVTGANANDVRDVAVSPATNKMFWSSGSDTRIRQSALDGTSQVDFITGIASPYGLAVDEEYGKIYWSQGGTSIHSANLDGSGQMTYVSGLSSNSWISLASPNVPDVTAPTPSISSTTTEITGLSTFEITIDFGETVQNFELGDISVGMGTASNLQTSDSISFTADITPATALGVKVEIIEGVLTDLASNANNTSNQLIVPFTVNTVSVVGLPGGTEYLTFQQNLNAWEVVLEASNGNNFAFRINDDAALDFGDDPGYDGVPDLGGQNLYLGADGLYVLNLGDSLAWYGATLINSLGMIGDALPEGYGGPDTDMTYQGSGVYSLSSIDLLTGTWTVRANNDNSRNWGDIGPNGVLDQQGPAISATAGVYNVTVDLITRTYSVTAPPNYVLSFDGANDRVELTRTQVTGGLTYEAWVKPAASVGVSGYDGSSGMTIIGDMNNDVGFSFGLTNSQLEMHHFNGSWQSVIGSTTLATDGTWYHVALTHDQSSGDVVLYLNGAVEQTGNIPWNANATYHSFNRIGSSHSTGGIEGDFFQGEIDEVRIWDDVRTATEISANYLNEVTGSEPNLISYYDFSDGSGPTLTDKSITGNDGIISGAVWNTTGPPLGPPILDMTAPFFTNSTPTITGVDDNDATLTVRLNETGQVHWGVYTQANTLSAEDVKNGIGTGGVIFGALNVPTANLDAVQLINSLAPSTSYYLYIAPEDSSGNFGALIEAQFTTDPAPENAMAFDGSSGYIALPSGFESIITQNFTVEAWINPNSIDRYAAIVDHMEWTGGSLSGYMLTLHETGELVARVYTGTDVVNDIRTPISAGSWQHVAMTYDGVQLKLYLNGNLEESTSASGLIDYSPVPSSHNIGRFHDSNEEYFFNGQIDEVRIWDVARTQGQIQSAFSTSLTSGSGLIASYVFNQSSYTLLDQTINGHNGGLNGGVSYVPSTALSTDITGPVLNNLAFANIGSTNVDLLFESDEEADLYYVFTQSATPPSAQQIIDGENELGATATDHAGTFESASAGSHDFGIGDNPASLPELIPNTQYYAYIVAEDSSGNRSAILTGDFTTNPLPVDLTFTTLSVAGTTLEQGSSDNLIYKVQMDVSGGTATMIGMFFSPTGTYIPSDITQFNYYHSIGVDDFENAVHLLSRGFFSGEAPAPDGALGLFFDSVYTDTTVYWYVTVDISATATGGNTLGIAAPSVGGNFGINESSNKIDGGLAASGTYTITTPPENALHFDGSDDYIDGGDLSSQMTSTGNFTIEAWVKSSTGGNMNIVHFGGNAGGDTNISLKSSTGSVFTINSSGHPGPIAGSPSTNDGIWHHVAAVYDGTDLTLYVDGVPETPDNTFDFDIDYSIFHIGNNSALNTPWNGEIDDVRIWNVARSATDILGNLTTKISSAPGLVASYDFNLDAGTALTDLTGNGHDGTLTNFDFLGTSSDWIASTVPSCAPNGKFIGATDSNWNDPSNWCGGVVPAANNVSENIVVSINSDITENQDLVLNANDFQVASGASLVLNLNSNSVQLTNNATFTNNGTVSVSNGTGVNATAGSFINNGVFFFEAGTQLASPTGTFVNNGILKGFFTVTNDFTNPVAGTVAPGASPGCANFVSDFTNAGTLEVEIDGTNPCSQYDQITVGGTANLAGTLNVTLGFTPISGNEFVIIDAAAISGTFTTVNLPDANWSIAYDFPGTGQVSLTYIDPSEMIGSTGPGGVGSTDGISPLQLWVKADAGTNTTVDAGAITTWSDQSGYGRTMTNGTSPTYQGNVINGQPVVRFSYGQYVEALGFTDNFTSSGFTVFTVAQWTGTGTQGYIGFKSQTGAGFNGGTTFFLDDSNGSPTDLRISSPSSGVLGNNQWSADNRSPRLLSFTRSTSLLNGYDGGTNVVSNVNEGAIYDGTQPWMIGRYNNDNLLYFTGDVAEFILFEGVLNTASRTVVENHLSAKYDIAHTVDLYAGDTGPNGDFDFDVIGIGKEADGSDPEGSAQGLTLTNAGFLQDNGDYIFAGHDGTAHAIVQSDLPVGYANRWARSWYVDVTDSMTIGTGGLATLTFDFDEAGLGLPNANLALITRPGTTGSYAVASTDFLIAGNKVSFTLDASAIIDGHTYTIADDYVPNNALLFDGVAGNYVQGPSLAGQITNDFTFETWFRTTASDHRMMIALGDHLGGAGAQAQLKVNSNSVLFGVNAVSSVVSPSATYTDGSWHHAAGVYSGTLLTLYLDGELIDTTSAALSMDLSAFKIGDHSGGNLVWDGELDNMRIWNVARTQSEIIANAYNTLLSDTTLVVSYDFNSSSGTTLFDGTVNGLDGTLVGTPPAWVSSTAWDIDIFAPIFEAGYPTITNINENDFDLTVQLNEEGTVYYVVLPDSATVPSNDDIKAGTDGLGGAAVVASSFPVNLIGSEVIANITGLSEGTSYDVYIVAEDDEGAPNTQKMATAFDITTLVFPENALSFDGTDDYVEVAANAAFEFSSGTIEAWIKPASNTENKVIAGVRSSDTQTRWSIHVNAGNDYFLIWNGSGSATVPVPIEPGTWYHVAFNISGSDTEVFVNGVSYGFAGIGMSALTGEPLLIGSPGSTQPSEFFEGEMDELRIWNTHRTQSEIFNNMNLSLATGSGLVASYDFNTGLPGGNNTGLNTLMDISGNGYDGTLNAFDLVGDTSNWVASEAFAPIIYQVSAANLNNLSVNWQPTNRGQVYVDINDASNFAGVPYATGHQIGNGSNSTSIVTGLSLSPNTRYFARIYYQDGGFTSPYSDTVEFMINAGSALNFDGTNDFVVANETEGTFSNLTISAWVRPTSLAASQWIYWRGNTGSLDGAELYITNTGQLVYGESDGTYEAATSAGSLPVSQWSHVAATKSGTNVQLYINGVPDGNNAAVSGVPPSGHFAIGARHRTTTANYFVGDIDEVSIWNIARSQAEIQATINNTLSGNENGLVAYYRFDEGDTAAVNTGIGAPEIIDLSGNGNVGTMSGFAKTGATSNWVASGAFTLDNNTAPLAPTEVIAFSSSLNNITLQWKDNSYNETGYLIENADDYDFTLNVDTIVANLGVNATSFVHSAGADQGYFYRVTPVNGSETGASTSEVEFATTKSFPGYALSFDGIADSVDMGSTGDLQISGALTYEVWIKTTQTQGFILGKRNGNDLGDLASSIELDGTGKVQGSIYDGSAGFPDVIQSNTAVNDGEWHHVAFVFEPAVALRLYIDGALDKTFGISSTNINGASYPFRVGKYPTSSSAFFDGEMDEIRVWNDVRSDAEISDNLYHDLKGNESNLVAYYPMDENSGTKLVDRSVNTNNGDIGGAGFIVSDVPLGPPMNLLSSTPSVNETNIARGANIQMTFDANVDAATLTGNIVVMGSHSGITAGAFTGGGTSVITFDPDEDFLAGEYISATITENVRGLDGEVAVPYNLQFAVATGPFQGAFVEQTTGLEGVVDGAAAWADYDGDGDLDIVVSGWDFDYTLVITKIFNNSAGSFIFGDSLTGVYEGSLDWGDYDSDGDLDLFVTGFDDGGSRTAMLYQNNAGTFTDVGGPFQGVAFSEADWGDFDNDGDLDLIVQGQYDPSNNASTILYRNDAGTFVNHTAGLVGVYKGDVAWGDYDNDGDLDIVSSGYTSNNDSIRTIIYENEGGLFTDIGAVLEGKVLGSVGWGDYDNDGDLDLMVSGSNTDSTPIIYRNDAGSFVDIAAGLLENSEGEMAWGDYDGDGDLDLVINGSGTTNGPTTTLYTNNAGTFVITDLGLRDYLYSTVDWGDYDNDGDLDLLLTGTDDFNGGRIALFSNALAPPTVLNPTNVSTAGFTPNLIAPSGAVDLIVDVSSDSTFGSFVSQGVSVGTSGGVDITVALTAGTEYFYRAKTDFGGGEESSYYQSNGFMVQPGNALPFTGNDYVEVFDNLVLEPTGDFTIEFWFNTDVIGNVVFLEKGVSDAEYSVQQSSGDKLGIYVNGGWMETNLSYNDSTWHHAAFVYRGPGDGTIYVDGVEDVNAGSVAALGTPVYSFGRLTIGDRRTGGSFNIEGLMDEVRIWDDERTFSEINDNRFYTLAGDEQGLIAYYQFDEIVNSTNLSNLSTNKFLDGELWNMDGSEWISSGALGAVGTVVSITADEANPAGSAIASELDWNIQFTSPVTGLTPGNFTLNSSGIGGGSSISSVTDVDGFNWTVTATVDTGDGTIGVDFTNDTGLSATMTNTPFVGEVYTVDRTAPAATLTSSEPDPSNSGSFTVDITFSEGVTGLGLGSVSVGNGIASNLIDIDGISYTVDIAPSTDGVVSVDLVAGAAQDIAGNDNSAASTFYINYDATSPTPVISSLEPDPTNSSPFIVNIDFSEPVTGFDLTDVNVTNGAKANLVETLNYAYDSQFGSAGSADGQFNDPYGIVEDGSGDIWVADRLNNRIQEFDPAGNFMQSISFSAPIGLAVDGSDNLYVTRTNNLVYKIDQSGAALLTIGTSGSGAGQFANPSDVAIDHATGDIYVTDYNNAKFLKYNSAGDFQWEVGSNGSGNGQFNYPTGIVVSGSTVYVTDDNNNRVQAFDTSGNFQFVLGSPGTGDGQLQGVDKIDVDGAGNVYVLDRNNHRFQVFTSGGNYLSQFGSGIGSADGQFNFPRGISFSASGDVLISDGGNNRIQRIKGGPSGNFSFELTPSADGSITVDVGGGAATDLAGNVNNSATQFSITADSQGPDVTINQSGAQSDPTNGTIVYDVIFSEPISGFTDDTNVDFASSTVGGSLSGSVSEVAPFDGTTYTLTVSGMTGTGDVVVNIQGGAATDLAGNFNSVSTSTDNTVTYDDVPPGLTITTPIASDNYVNSAEASSVIISGTSDAEDGRTVTLTIFDGSTTLNPTSVVSGSSWSVPVDFSSLADGNVTITADVTDLAGNAATSVNANVTLDRTAPALTLSNPISGDDQINNSEVSSVTLSGTSGAEDGQTVNLTIFDGSTTLSPGATMSGGAWSIVVDFSSLAEGNVSITADVDDLAGNSATSASVNVTVDRTVPTLTINSPIAGDDIINISEVSSVTVSGTSDAEDGRTVTLTIFDGSTTLNPSAVVSGSSWSVPVDFSSLADGNVTITADVSDLAGNPATSVNTNVTLDQTAPSVLVFSSEPNPTNSSTFTIDVSFDEPVTGFDISDILVVNASLGNFVDLDGLNYTVDVSPDADGVVTIDVAGSVAQDASANDNSAATQFTITSDRTAPTVVLSTTEPDPTNSGIIPVSIAFSEGMSGFDLTDLTVGNGAASNFVDIDGTNYSVDVYPSSDGLVTVDISAGSAFDAAFNGNVSASPLSITYDSSSPTLDFVGIYSSNSNYIWAMVGDDVFVDFTSSEDIENVTVYIAGNLAVIDDLSDADDKTWSASYTMQTGDTESSIPFTIDFQDLSGNAGVQVTSTTDASDVTFDKTDPGITGNGTQNIIENTSAIGAYSSGEIVIWSLSGDDASTMTIDGSGNLNFVSPRDFETPGDFDGDNVYDVVLEATDEAGNIGTLAVSVTVTDLDEINPVISGNGTPSVQENTTSVGTYTADESVTWSLSGTDASAFSISSGVLTFLSAPDFESPSDGGSNNVYDVIVTGTDGAGNVGTLAVSVTVTDADEINPVISGNGTPSVQENTTSVGTYTADESVTWSLSGTDASAFSITSGVLTFLSSPDFESPGDGGSNNVYDVIVTGTDGAGNVGTLAVSVTVTDVDEINPVISGNSSPSIQENTTSVGTYTADESVTWSLSGTDASAFSITSGVLTFLSSPDFESPGDGGSNNVYDVIVTGTDGAGNVGTLAVSVTVTDVDEINPVISGNHKSYQPMPQK
ncbi:putative Peptidylamidoglycolate lyase [Marinoscillum sp. 108]|nr:putative Peptidylamidoglycolate lyase [Marinoscillum sp. 108]